MISRQMVGWGLVLVFVGWPQALLAELEETIELEKEVHFLTPDEATVVVPPGYYTVEAEENGLQLTHGLLPDEGGETFLLQAKKGTHEDPVDSPIARSIAVEEDAHYLSLLLPDGQSLVAIGSYSGVRPRGAGWSEGLSKKAEKAFVSADCFRAEVNLTEVLEKRYRRKDTRDLQKRRIYLRKSFNKLTPTCAKEIRRKLGKKVTNHEISRLFHLKLSRHLRKELLAILDGRIRATPRVTEGEFEIGFISNNEIARAANRAKRILSKAKVNSKNRRGIKKLQCIVKKMSWAAERDARFNADYYPVGPIGKNLFHTDNPLTCWKQGGTRKGGPTCRTGKDAIEKCRRSLSKDLVQSNIAGESDREILKNLLYWEGAIDYGLRYFEHVRTITRKLAGQSNENIMLCRSAIKQLLPKMTTNEFRSDHSIYECYDNP